MDFNILVRPVENGFIATVTGLPDCTVEASTREEAIRQAEQEAKEWLEKSEVIPLESIVPPKRSPKDFIGMWADDELFDEFVEAMKQYRAELDTSPDAL